MNWVLTERVREKRRRPKALEEMKAIVTRQRDEWRSQTWSG